MKSRKNITLLCCIAFLQGMVFYAPVASLYRQAAGLNLAQIALIESISYIIGLAMELPWGMLADRIGYRRTMIAGCGIYFLSKLVFWRAGGFGAFLLERFLLSAALAALSGVDQSLLYLSCKPEESQQVFGRYEACGTAGMLLASGAFLLCIRENYPAAALATMIAYALAALLSLFLQDAGMPRARERSSLRGMLALLRQTLGRRRLALFIAGLALFQEAGQMITVWLNQNQYLRCGMGEGGIGAAYILVSLSMLLSAQSKRFTDMLGARRFGTTALLASAAACALLVFTRSPYLSTALIAMVAAARALLGPLAAAALNRSIPSANRATTLSLFALMQNCVAAGAQAICGRVADASLDAAFMLCALAALAACCAFRRFLPKAAR